MIGKFHDRREAGRLLVPRLEAYRNRDDCLILALPRGGVIIGFELATRLNIPLDLLLVRKIGSPTNPELAAGAVSETGAVILNEEVIRRQGISRDFLRQMQEREGIEIERRRHLYRGGRGLGPLAGKTVILVDDGVATGATLKAAIATLKRESLQRLVVALPVAPPETAERLAEMVDEWICLQTPPHFPAVGTFYEDFAQVTDAEVIELLREIPVGPRTGEHMRRSRGGE